MPGRGVGWLVSQHALRQTPPGETATTADGTHPTGMHSCLILHCTFKKKTPSVSWGTYLALIYRGYHFLSLQVLWIIQIIAKHANFI